MNVRKSFGFLFIVHHSAFIVAVHRHPSAPADGSDKKNLFKSSAFVLNIASLLKMLCDTGGEYRSSRKTCAAGVSQGCNGPSKEV
jgi:hypothetical protein